MLDQKSNSLLIDWGTTNFFRRQDELDEGLNYFCR